MGLFDGLTGRNRKAKFRVLTSFDLLPGFLKGSGKEIGTQSFDLFRDLIESGESDAAAELFARSRANTTDTFRNEVRNASLAANRAGLASSGFNDKRLAAQSLQFADLLSAQDASRAENLESKRLSGATQGLNAINAIGSRSALIPQVRERGLFDGFGTQLLGRAVSTGLGNLLGGSVFGGGSGGLGSLFNNNR